jgi:hypothetical protein
MAVNDDPGSVSQKYLAKCFGKTTRTMQAWTDDGMPRNADGTYSIADCFQWSMSGATDGGLDPTQELARKNKALADKTEMEIAVRAGELGVVAEVADWYGGHIRKAKSRLVQIPDAVGQFCDPKAAVIVVAEVRRLIHEALAELAAGRPAVGGVGSGGVGTAADPDGESVGGSES